MTSTTSAQAPLTATLLDSADPAPLFTPFTLSGVELANRFVMAPMTRSFSPGGVPGRTWSITTGAGRGIWG